MAATALNALRARNLVPAMPRKPPSALTERRLSLICERIANGVPMTPAAVASGVPRRTFQEWLEKGRRVDAVEPYKSMADRIELALAVYQESRIELVTVGAEKDPRFAQWELERRFREDWGEPTRGVVTVNVGVIVESPEWAALRDAALVALARHPEALADYLAAIGGAPVVEGEVMRELTP